MSRKTNVYVKTTFIGFHRWKDAPPEHAYLANWHRHVFHVRMMVAVTDTNREVEFIALKRKLDAFLFNDYECRHPGFEESCEQIAHRIMDEFGAVMVDVSEDGENGAVVLAADNSEKPRSATQFVADTLAAASAIHNKQREVQRQMAEAVKNICQVPTVKARREELTTYVQTKVFYGVEVEGPNRGKPTIFVPGSLSAAAFRVAWEDVMAVARDADMVDCVLRQHLQVYLGAGNDNYRVTRELYDTVVRVGVPPKNITVEVKDLSGAPWVGVGIVPPPPITVVVHRITDIDRLKRAGGEVYVKSVSLRDGSIVWHNLVDGRGFVASLDDQLFGEDDTHPAKMLRHTAATCNKPV